MALIKCPDCGKDVSDEAPSCIHCGKPKPGEIPPPETPQQKLQRELEGESAKPASKKSGCGWVLLPIIGILVLLGMCASQQGQPPSTPGMPSSSATPSRNHANMATLLVLNGLLCAEAIEVRKLAQDGKYEVRCIEYRGGSGTVDYIVDLDTGKAFRR